MSAVDGDVGENAVIKYRIQRGAFQDFSLHPDTGVLSVARTLDYDRRDTYAIEVLGADGGRPQKVRDLKIHLKTNKLPLYHFQDNFYQQSRGKLL